MILFGIIFSFIYCKLDLTRKKIFAWPLIIFILFYSISFDVITQDQIESKIFIHFKLNLSLRSYIYYFFTCCAFAIGIHIACTQCKSPILSIYYNYNLRKIKILYYSFVILTMIGFCINLSRVIGNMGLLFVSPREYEELFGASSLINYLYFLNIPALCLFVLLNHHKQKVEYNEIFYSILFFGRITPYKGLGVLLDAFELAKQTLPMLKLTIAGNGEVSESEQNIINRNHDCIDLINQWLPETEIYDLFSKSDLVVLPYIEASQSGVAAAAFGAGRTIIASDIGGLKEQVEPGGGITVKPCNPEALANALIELYRNPELIKEKNKQALKYFEQALTWDASAQKLIEFLYR